MEVIRPILKYCGFIYKITNKINNKVYIGLTKTSINTRFSRHKSTAFNINSEAYNLLLYRAIRKYGPENFIPECIFPIYASSLKILQLLLDLFEKFYIKKYCSDDVLFGYNLTPGGLVFPQLICHGIRNRFFNTGCCVEGCLKPEKVNGYCRVHVNQINTLGYILNTYKKYNEIIYNDGFAELCLYDKNHNVCAKTKIDLEDIEKVSKIKWHLNNRERGIGVSSSKGVLHNYILDNNDKNLIVYHINGDNLDNRKSNLKLISKSDRALLSEKLSNSKSDMFGIYFIKTKNKFQVKVKVGKKWKYVGEYKNLDESKLIRDYVNKNPVEFFSKKELEAFNKISPKQEKENKIYPEICSVDGCTNKHKALGYCQKHYNQIYNFGSIRERTLMDRNEIVYYDDYAEIILYNKSNQEIARTKIDIEDVKKVKNIKWTYCKGPRGEHIRSSNPKVALHNYLLNHTNFNFIVIHKNGDNLDNRKENLFIVSQKVKLQNSKILKNNKSGYKGVWWCKDRNKWQAQITINNKLKSLGRFNTLEEAINARILAEKQYYNK